MWTPPAASTSAALRLQLRGLAFSGASSDLAAHHGDDGVGRRDRHASDLATRPSSLLRWARNQSEARISEFAPTHAYPHWVLLSELGPRYGCDLPIEDFTKVATTATVRLLRVTENTPVSGRSCWSRLHPSQKEEAEREHA
jgi:hypothetical protein